MLEIREAQDSDLDDLVRLVLEVHRLHLQHHPDEFREPAEGEVRPHLESALVDRTQGIMVCLEETRTMGYVLYRIVDRKENPFQKARVCLYIDQLDVELSNRRRGIGKMLMDSIKILAGDRNVDQVILDVWAFNDEAVSFFVSQGFRPMIHRMALISD